MNLDATEFRFGRFRLDPVRHTLIVDGEPSKLGARAIDVLLVLVRNRDRIVSKDELLKLVWPGLVVEENNLQVHVSALRKLLGAATISTVPGRGYQFIAPVTEIPEDAGRPAPVAAAATAEPPIDEPPIVLTPPARRSWRLPLLLAGALLLVGLALVWRTLAPPAVSPGSEVPYVLVVPFDVSGGSPEAWGPFADQVTRELIRNLRKISGLNVVPAPSAFTFKGNKTREHVRA